MVKGAAPIRLTNCPSATSTSADCPSSYGVGALSGDGNRVIWTGGDDKLHLYGATTGATTQIFAGVDVYSPIISGNGQLVALESSDLECVAVVPIGGTPRPPPTARSPSLTASRPRRSR